MRRVSLLLVLLAVTGCGGGGSGLDRGDPAPSNERASLGADCSRLEMGTTTAIAAEPMIGLEQAPLEQKDAPTGQLWFPTYDSHDG